MLRSLTIFAFLITVSTISLADENRCEFLLDETAISKLAQLPHTDLIKKANLEKIEAALHDIQLSELRNDLNAYDSITQFLIDLNLRLDETIREKKVLLERQNISYLETFGSVSRAVPWGKAAAFKKSTIAPLAKEIDEITSANKFLTQLAAEANNMKNSGDKEALVQEAKLILGIATKDYSTNTAIAFAKSLMGYKGDLRTRLTLAGEIFNEFYKDFSSEPSASLTSTLLGRNQTDSKSRQRIKKIYEAFNLLYDKNVSASLASITFNADKSVDSVENVKEIYNQLYKNTGLDYAELIPLVSYFVQRAEKPSIEEIKAIEKKRVLIYKHPSVDSYDSALMLAILLNAKGMEFSEIEAKPILDAFDRYYKGNATSSAAAAILAVATFLIEKPTQEIADDVISIWKDFYKLSGVSSEAAAGLTLKVVLNKYGVSKTLIQDASIDPDTIDETSSSATDSIFSVTQGMITGSFINIDGNVFTRF